MESPFQKKLLFVGLVEAKHQQKETLSILFSHLIITGMLTLSKLVSWQQAFNVLIFLAKSCD